MPTAFGRGAFLATMPIEEIEKEINHALYDGAGVLSRVSVSTIGSFFHSAIFSPFLCNLRC
jgi:hypothetical protein